MKISNIEVMILKVDQKINKDNQQYWLVSLATIEDGETFNIIVKDYDKVKNFEAFQKAVVNFKLSNSKYGIALSLE